MYQSKNRAKEQTDELERYFNNVSRFLGRVERKKLARKIGLSSNEVKMWFKDRHMKEREQKRLQKKLDDEKRAAEESQIKKLQQENRELKEKLKGSGDGASLERNLDLLAQAVLNLKVITEKESKKLLENKQWLQNRREQIKPVSRNAPCRRKSGNQRFHQPSGPKKAGLTEEEKSQSPIASGTEMFHVQSGTAELKDEQSKNDEQHKIDIQALHDATSGRQIRYATSQEAWAIWSTFDYEIAQLRQKHPTLTLQQLSEIWRYGKLGVPMEGTARSIEAEELRAKLKKVEDEKRATEERTDAIIHKLQQENRELKEKLKGSEDIATLERSVVLLAQGVLNLKVGTEKKFKSLEPLCPETVENFSASVRNLGLEKIANTARLPCKFSNAGCPLNFHHIDKKGHEKLCEYRPYSCPCPGAYCKWQGALADVMDHLKKVHESVTTLHGEDIVFLATDINLKGAVDWVMIQSCFEYNFLLVLEKQYDPAQSTQMFYAVVQLIGSKKEADKFVYRLELSANGRQMLWQSTPRSIHEGVACAIQQSDCLAFDTSAAQFFAENGNLGINVTISRLDQHQRRHPNEIDAAEVYYD